MVESNECPVGHYTSNPLLSFEVLVDNKVLDSSSIHHDDVGHGKNLGQQRRGKQCRMLNDNKWAFVLVRDPKCAQEAVSGLPDYLAIVAL